MASSIENSPRIDDHAGRMHFSRHHSLRLNLDAASCKYHPIEVPRDHHAVSFDLSFNLCVLTQNHGLFRDYISLNMTVNTKRSCERQRAFQRHALIDESCPLFAAATLRCAGPLPRHESSPKSCFAIAV